MHPKKKMMLVLISGAFLFAVIFPLLIYYFSILIDSALSIPKLNHLYLRILLGLAIGSIGGIFAAWAVYAQYRYGYGTPVPLMPPIRLVTEGPYKYSRNPMALGTMLYYVGLGILIGSYSYILITIIGFTLLFIYNKFFEEKELEKKIWGGIPKIQGKYTLSNRFQT